MSDHANVPLNVTGDVISGVAVVGTLMGYLPDLAAIVAMLWYGVQLWDWWVERGRRNDAKDE